MLRLQAAPTLARRAARRSISRTTTSTARPNLLYAAQQSVASVSGLHPVPTVNLRQQHRTFSDKLLGYSPMGGDPLPLLNHSKEIPTKEAAEIGGVWVKDSAKRDKLLELKSELATASKENAVPNLEVAATDRQKLDLWLVDGLKLLALQTETDVTENSNEKLQSILQSLQDKLQNLPEHLHQVQWEEALQDVISDLNQHLSSFPAGRCLLPVRDYYDASREVNDETEKEKNSPAVIQWILTQGSSDAALTNSFAESVTHVRLQTTLAFVQHLQASWKTLTAVTDQDVDRAAVRHEVVEDATTLPSSKLLKVLTATLVGSGSDRFDALWDLMDKDDDGSLDQEEVQQLATLAVTPAQTAMQTVLQEALDASPVGFAEPVGWRQRRRETKDKKRLTKQFQKAVTRHFDQDLQQPHRLRCIYAWANKAHQDNKIDSVLVEDEGGVTTTIAGRKRYVELQPKISLPQFREVQSIHFPQLDRVASELLESFRDDLLVYQGKGRQRKELLFDCTLFFTGLCVLDFVILSL